MGKNKNKPIIEVDKPGGKPILYWPSAKEASEFYKINQVNISYNVNGVTKQAKGHYFRFATPKEIAAFEKITASIKPDIDLAPPVVKIFSEIQLPVETIPEVVQNADPQGDALSPFARLLQESKNKFENDSK